MKRSVNQAKSFLPLDGVLQNPYIGFTTFNHYRGQALFPETGTKDGWIKERYPIYDWIADYGKSEGYYPDCEIVYIRIVWCDFEPEEGEFNFALTDDIFRQAKEHGQSVMLRLMPHTTRENEDVPAWLRAKIPCPARPTEARVKDSPTDALFLQSFARAIRALGARYDGNPSLYAVDISLTGAWGEGHGWDAFPKEQLHDLVDAYTESFANTPLMGQICAPELVRYANQKKPVGFRADGLGESYHMNEYLPKSIAQMDDVWQKAPVSFEAYWYLNEWERHGWDVDEIIDKTLEWHVSSINGKSSGIPEKWKKNVDRWLCKMGYRFAVRNIEYPKTVNAADRAQLILRVENCGVAPIYHKLPLIVRAVGPTTEFSYTTEVDIRNWLPGEHTEIVWLDFPQDLPVGEYRIECAIGGEDGLPYVQMAMQTETDGRWHFLATITVEA